MTVRVYSITGKFYFMRSVSNERYGGDNNAIGVTLPDGTDLKPLPIEGYVFVQPMTSALVDVVGLGAVPDGESGKSSNRSVYASILTYIWLPCCWND